MTPSLIVNGLVSGITTKSVINALLQSYQVPINALQTEQTAFNTKAADYRQISTDLQGVLTAAQTLSSKTSWNMATATTSDTQVATAAASQGAQTGSLTFTVNQLAQANVLASASGVSAPSDVVASTSAMLLASGAQALGFSSLSPGTGLGLGAWTMTVTQASAAATVAGSSALGASTTIGTSNDTVTLTLGATAFTLTIAAGSYSATQLATALNAAAASAGAGITASVAPTGAVALSTTEQGSAASLTVTGGSALGALKLANGQTGAGADAIVTLGGVTTTLTSVTAGGTLTISAPGTATVTATVTAAPGATGALVASGTAQLASVSTGNGSLTTVVSAINSLGIGATANAVQTASGSYILEVSADKTGTANEVSLTSAVFTGSALGSLQTLVAAQTAEVSVGGTNGYTLSSSTDSFTSLMHGTTVTVGSTGQATVTVSPDVTGEATKVTALVAATNKALADIQKYAGYTASTKTAGPLMGDMTLESVKQQILSVFATAVGTSSLGDLSAAGVSLTGTGTVSFTRTAFVSAYNANPAQVQALFTQDGTFAPTASAYAGTVSLAYAGTTTPVGTYAVSISQAAAQATDLGATRSTGTVTASETLTITMGGVSAPYTTSAGESLTQVAAGINSSLAQAGIAVSAQVVGGTQLELQSSDYGSAAHFTVSTTTAGTGTTGLGGSVAATPVTFQGTNVAGTIGGVAATGTGQVLTGTNGLALLVTASGITTTTRLGTLTYVAGAAQQLVSITNDATNTVTGSLTNTITSLTHEATALNPQIAMYEQMKTSQRSVLVKEFARMEQALGQLKSESSSLASAIAGLP